MGVSISPALNKKIRAIDEMAEDAIERKLLQIAQDIVRLSPVDTGAFVNSWSFKDNPMGGRRKSSKGKPRQQLASSQRGKSLNNLVNDIITAVELGSTRGPSRADLQVSAAKYYFINGAPHAKYVDLKSGFSAQIRNLHG